MTGNQCDFKDVSTGDNALKKVQKHDTCRKHLIAETKFAAMQQHLKDPSTDIAARLTAADAENITLKDKNRRLNRSGLIVIFCSVMYLAMQGLAFRGHDESENSTNRGNFKELLEYSFGAINDERSDWFKNLSERNTYSSATTQNIMINIVANQIREAILVELNDGDPRRIFSICADEVTDSSKKEQMSIYIRYCTKDGILVERNIAVVQVPSTKADALLNAILVVLKQFDLDPSRIYGQCYDGASNMSGEFNGLQQKLRESGAKHAVYVHCYAHRLNLVIVDMAKTVPIIAKFFASIQALSVLVGASAKRQHFFTAAQKAQIATDHLKAICEEDSDDDSDDDDDDANVGDKRARSGEKALRKAKPQQPIKLKQIGATRWSCRVYALMAIMRTYACLLEALKAIADDATDAKHIAEALGLRLSMLSFDFIIVLFIMIKILDLTHNLSQLLQRRNQDLGNAADQVRYTMNALDGLRSDESWESIWNEADTFATNLNCGIVVPGRDTIVSNRVTDIRNFMPGARHIDGNTVAPDWFRINVFYVALDKIGKELRDRFNNANIEILQCIIFFLPKRFADFDEKYFLAFASEFWQREADGKTHDQRKFDKLHQELKFFKDLIKKDHFKAKDLVSLEDVLKYLIRDQPSLKMIIMLYRIALTLPVSSASAERCFSAMKRIKNRLRSTMGDERMADLILIAIEKEIGGFKGKGDFDLEKMVDSFKAQSNGPRIDL